MFIFCEGIEIYFLRFWAKTGSEMVCLRTEIKVLFSYL